MKLFTWLDKLLFNLFRPKTEQEIVKEIEKEFGHKYNVKLFPKFSEESPHTEQNF